MPIFTTMRNWFLVLPALILLAACSQQQASQQEYNVQKDSLYTIIDSSAKTDVFFKYDGIARVAVYQIFYIGEAKKSYTLPSRALAEFVPLYTDTGRYSTRYTNKTISIFVDTALDISKKLEFRHEITDSVKKEANRAYFKVDSVKHYKAYPIFITNLSDSLMFLGQHNYINHMVREAKDEQGQWKPLEQAVRYWDCNKCRLVYLKPKQVLVAKMMRFTGNFKTECRLRFGTGENVVYSNTFVEYIDKRALVAPDSTKAYLKLN